MAQRTENEAGEIIIDSNLNLSSIFSNLFKSETKSSSTTVRIGNKVSPQSFQICSFFREIFPGEIIMDCYRTEFVRSRDVF
jgi:AraC-like DNA-binding protein